MGGRDNDSAEHLRALPSVDRVMTELAGLAPPTIVADAARRAVADARQEILAGSDAPSIEAIAEAAATLLERHGRSLLKPVINATGVLIHTNLGRVPMSSEQLDVVRAIASGYSNLEYDLEAGRRGSRYEHAAGLITAATGAEAAVVVNNNAAAVLLCLAALCSGKEVVVSRGELIEIGGEFRLPDVMAISGARLVEVGTTNRTHLADYERAITADTAAILKVHPSNYTVVGFTSSVPARELGELADERGLHFINDLGSGLLGSVGAEWTRSEPPVGVALEDGVDIVTFSGDKLLGGPQAGIIAGRKKAVSDISKHPLMRVLRVDKMTLAALEATFTMYLEGRIDAIPLWHMALTSPEDLAERARVLARAIEVLAGDAVKVEAVATAAVTGGGSLPGTEIGSWGVAITHSDKGPDALGRALREVTPPVIARIEGDRVVMDLRTVRPEDDALLTSLVAAAIGSA